MKVLVTGASGFIGSGLSMQLGIQGHEVLCVDSNSSYYATSLKVMRIKEFLAEESTTFRELDLCDFSGIDDLISGFKPDAIVHLAAQAGVRLIGLEMQKYVKSNLEGFSNILISSVKNSVPKFLYASSSSVYGNNATLPFTERQPNLSPTSFYGATKLANEILAASSVIGSQTRARGLRFFTVYGPWGRPDMAYFRMISSALTGSQFTFFGDGTIARDFTYIDDVLAMISKLIIQLDQQPPGFSDVVNIGGGRPLTMKFLINEINRQTGNEIKVLNAQGNQLDVHQTAADYSYLEEIIGDHPNTSLEEGLARTIFWAKTPSIVEKLNSWVTSTR